MTVVRKWSAGDLVDDASRQLGHLLDREAPVFWLCALPCTAAMIRLCYHLLLAGSEAHQSSLYFLQGTALVALTLPLALYGQARLLHANRQLHGLRMQRAAGLGRRRLLLHLQVQAVVWTGSWLAGFTLLPLLLLPWSTALTAAVTTYCQPARLGRILPDLFEVMTRLRTLCALWILTLGVALLIFINLHGLLMGIIRLGSAWGAWQHPTWAERLHWHNPLYLLILIAGTFWFLHPILLTTAAALCFRIRSRTDGEDLLAWIRDLDAQR